MEWGIGFTLLFIGYIAGWISCIWVTNIKMNDIFSENAQLANETLTAQIENDRLHEQVEELRDKFKED